MVKEYPMRIDGFEFLIKKGHKVVGLITEDREIVEFKIKPGCFIYKLLESGKKN